MDTLWQTVALMAEALAIDARRQDTESAKASFNKLNDAWLDLKDALAHGIPE